MKTIGKEQLKKCERQAHLRPQRPAAQQYETVGHTELPADPLWYGQRRQNLGARDSILPIILPIEIRALRGQAQLMSADNRIAAIWRTSRQGNSRLDQHHRTERTEITARFVSHRVSCIDTGILMPFRRCN